MRTIKCKQCETRMWDDEDDRLYCPNCGWEAGTTVEDEESPDEGEF